MFHYSLLHPVETLLPMVFLFQKIHFKIQFCMTSHSMFCIVLYMRLHTVLLMFFQIIQQNPFLTLFFQQRLFTSNLVFFEVFIPKLMFFFWLQLSSIKHFLFLSIPHFIFIFIILYIFFLIFFYSIYFSLLYFFNYFFITFFYYMISFFNFFSFILFFIFLNAFIALFFVNLVLKYF